MAAGMDLKTGWKGDIHLDYIVARILMENRYYFVLCLILYKLLNNHI